MKKPLQTCATAMTEIRAFLQRHNRLIAAAALICFVVGLALSHRLEPGVTIQTVTLADDTPALKFIPTGTGPHPVALLAHGFGCSKEALFRYAEALTAAGFACYNVDLPGHGASSQTFTLMQAVQTLQAVAREIGPVDVFLGHSMGGFAGGEAVHEGRLKPALFIAVGSLPVLGDHSPSLVYLAGRFEEFFSPALLKTRTDGHVVISPWCDHVLEMWDPLLINAAVEQACDAAHTTPPPPPTAWRWRLVGLVLAILGACTLAFYLPELFPQLAPLRGLLLALFLIVSVTLTAGYAWLDTAPHAWVLPKQFAAMAVVLLLALLAARLRIPRWSILVLGLLVLVIGFCWWQASESFATFKFMAFISVGLTPALILGTAIGWLASRRGSRLQGDIAMAIVVGWAAFQWKLPPTAADASKPHLAIKLDAKLLDACVGQYEFPPENYLGVTGTKLTISRQGDQLRGQFIDRDRNIAAFNLSPESETNFFVENSPRQFTFIKSHGSTQIGTDADTVVKNNDTVTAVIFHPGQELPDSEGKKSN